MQDILTKKGFNKDSEEGSNFAGIFKIHDTQVINQNIELLEVKEWALQVMPRLEMVFKDPKIFFDFVPLQDNDLIEFNLSFDPQSSETISSKFRLLDFENNIVTTNFSDVRLTAYLDVDNIFDPIYNRALKGSSSDVIKKLADEMNIEVDIRVPGQDSMVWYQTNMSNFEMINHVANRAYAKENDAVFVYIDRHGKIIYTTINTEMKKEPILELLYNENRRAPEEDDGNTQKKKNTKNNSEDDEKTLYYDSIKYVNKSGYINKMIGYGKSYSYNILGEMQDIIFSTTGNKLTDFTYQDKDKLGKTVQHEYFGMLSGNMHDNYFKALVQNQYLKMTQFSSPILVSIDPTSKINIFDIIDLKVPKSVRGEINESYSGKYFVGGIHYYIMNSESPNMLLALFRNGINKNSYIEDDTWHLNKN